MSPSIPKEFIFVRATSSTVLKTAREAHELKLVKPILVGEQEVIEKEASLIGLPLKNIEIIATKDIYLPLMAFLIIVVISIFLKKKLYK